MHSPAPRLLRGYGPLVAGAALFALMAALAPTVGHKVVTRTVAQKDSSTASGDVAANDSSLAASTDATVPGGGRATSAAGRSTRGALPPGAQGACSDRRVQVPGDTYSPICVAFSGSNGGAKGRGVSGDTILVSSRVLSDAQSFQDTISQLTGGKISTSAEETKRTALGLVDYFNSHFQFYGRKIKLAFFDGKGQAASELLGGGQEEAEADAVKVAEEFKAFADISAFTVPYADALARRKVVNVGAPYLSREWFVNRRPYSWSVFPDCSIVTESVSDWGNKRLQGRPASHAGGSLKGKTRSLAVVAPDNPWYQECVDAGLKIVHAAGNKVTDRIAYKLDLNSMSNQAANIVAKLKNDGITTIVCGCDPIFPIFLTAKAKEQGIEPEWIVTGTALTDVDIVGQLYDQDQWSHAFGISYNGAYQPLRASYGYNAYKAVRSDEPDLSVDLVYYQLYVLSLGIQGAGPDLTPESFERGMFAYGGGAGPAGTWGFGPRQYTPTQDAREIYWDPKRVSKQNNQPGAYVETEPGKRYRAGQWPTGDPPVPQ